MPSPYSTDIRSTGEPMTRPDTVTLPRATVDAVREALKCALLFIEEAEYDYSSTLLAGDKARAALALIEKEKDK